MKKRLFVFAMVFVLFMTSLIGFKSQDVAAASLSDGIEQEQTAGAVTYNYSFGLTSTGNLLEWVNNTADESVKQVLTDLIQAEYQIKMTRESVDPFIFNYKFAIKKAGSDQAIPITTLLWKNNTYYINMAELKECFNSFQNPTMSMIAGIFTTKEEYLKLTDDDLNVMLGIYEDADTNMTMADYLEYEKEYTKLAVMINENFEKAVKDISPAPLYKEEGKVTLNINTGNYEAIVNNICEDIIKNKERYLDQCISAFEKLPYYKDVVSEWKAEKQVILNNTQEICNEMMTMVKENKLKDTDGLNFKWEITETGTRENLEIASDINFYIKLTEVDAELGFYMKSNTKEVSMDTDRMIIPEKSTTLDEYLNSILQY